MRSLARPFLSFCLLVAGCGAGDTAATGSSTDSTAPGSNTAPVASALTFSPKTATVGEPFTLQGSLAFTDDEGNLATLYVRFQNPDGTTSPAIPEVLSDVAGLRSGNVPFSFPLTPSMAGAFTLEVWLEDSAGAASSVLTGTIDVTGGAEPGTAPVLSTLAYQPKAAKTGEAVEITGTFTVVDAEGDAATWRAVVTDAAGAELPEAIGAITSVAAGVSTPVDFAITVTPPTKGTYTLTVTATDSAGHTSAAVTGTIGVTDDAVNPTNTAPTASGLTFAPTSATVGDSVEVKGTFDAADVDGNLKARYVRITTPDGTQLPPKSGLISGPSGQTTASIPFTLTLDADVAGTYTVEAWVDDKEDVLSNVITGSFTASEATPTAPVITNLSFLPDTAKVGANVFYSGSVQFTDADGDVATLNMRFRLADGTVVVQDDKALTQLANPKAGVGNFSFSYVAPTAGTYTFEVWISDAAGHDSNVLTSEVVVTGGTTPVNSAPTSSGLTFAPTSASDGDFVKVTGTFAAADVDGNLSVWFARFVAPGGKALTTASGVISGASTQTTATIPFTLYLDADSVGDYTLEVWARDTAGLLSNVTTGALTVAAVAPTAPTATTLQLSPKAVKTGLSVKYSGQLGFKDPDADLKAAHFQFTRPDGTKEAEVVQAVGSLSTGGNVLFSLNYTAASVGDYTFEAWVEDALGAMSGKVSTTVVASAPFVASNEAPVATSLVFEPSEAVVGQLVTVTGSFIASDADGNLSTRSVRARAPDGTALPTSSAVITGPLAQTSATVSFTYGFVPTALGQYTLEVSALDAAAATSNVQTGAITVTAASANAPIIGAATLQSAVASTGVSKTFAGEVSFTDLDGDVNLLHLRFRRPGALLSSTTTTAVSGLANPNAATVPFSLTYAPPSAGTYTLEVWFSDALGHTSAPATVDVIVTSAPKPSNSIPLAGGLVFQPSSAYQGAAVTVSGAVDVTDVDANLASLVLRFKKPSGIGLPEVTVPLALPDLSGGQATFTTTVTPDVVGNWTLEAYAKDTSGAKSTTISGSFVVSAAPSLVPVASAVSVSPSAVEANVAVTYTGAVSFTDTDGDVSAVNVRFKRPGGTVSAVTVVPVDSLTDPTAGEAPFSVTYTATIGGAFTLEAWLTDSAGHTSATVTAPITVTAPVVAGNSAPSVQDLAFSPASATVGTPVSLVGTFFATDVDMNWGTARYRFRRPSGVALPEASVTVTGLTNKASGTVSFTRAITPDAAGLWMLEVTLVDAAGAASPTVASSFTVDAVVLPSVTAPKITKLAVQPLSVIIDKEKTLTGTVQITDADGDAEVLTVGIVDPTGAPLPETLVTLTGFGGQTAFTAPFTMQFTATMVGDYVLEAWVDDLEGQSSNIAAATIVASDLSNVNSACAALETDCTGQGFCYDVNSTTCDYLDEKQVPFAPCDQVGSTGTVAACVSSIADTTSPYASTDANCGFVQYWSNPTVFPIDCRCGDAAFESPCKRPYELSSVVTFGDGPRPRNLATEMRLWNGPVYGREWFVPAFWKTSSKPNQTMIYAINLDTGNRRFFSGAYNDFSLGLTRVGSGPDFVQVMDMALGPDGQFYAVGAASEISEPKIWRVDPATGNRTLIFDAATAPASALCPNGSTLPGLKTVQMAAQGWAMDGQGRFYFSNVNQPGPSIVRISADGAHCDYVTSVVDIPSNTRDNVGAGYDDIQFDFRAFHIEGEKLYAVSNTLFLEVDLPTGNRKVLSKATDVGNLGAGPINAEGLGDRWTRYDPYRQLFWTVGAQGGSSAVAVDPATGNRFTWPCWHPTLGGPLTACGGTGKALIPGYLNFGGFVIDPEGEHNLFFAHDTLAIVKYDVKTGNAYTFSL